MKKMIGLLLALAMVMTLGAAAFAATGGTFTDGDNTMELPWDTDDASVYTYTATQTGTLYIMATEFGYAIKDYDYSDNSSQMDEWMMYTELAIDGTALSDGYYGSIEVVEGQTYTFSWRHLYATEKWYTYGWSATLNLSYTDDLLPRVGTEELPAELHIEQCPTDSIEIGAGEVAYYIMYDFDGTCFTVTGENAYVQMKVWDMENFVQYDVTYEAENGVVTVPLESSYCTIQIGNDGDAPAVFGLDYYYPLGGPNRPAELIMGENVAVTEKDNYDGYYFTWTATETGTLMLLFPETGWMYEISNTTDWQYLEALCSDSDADNPVYLEVTRGDVIRIIVNTYNAGNKTVPGGELRFVASMDCAHKYEVTAEESGTCVRKSSTTYTCAFCGHSYTEEGQLDDTVHGTLSLTGEADASCSAEGYTGDQVCDDCGAVISAGEVTPKLDHSYEAAVTAPTCAAGGYTTYTCAVCGHSYTAEETAPLAHSYETAVTAPDCTNGGYTTYTCTVCGDTYDADETAALGHSYETAVTAPDCTNGGYTTYTCAVCGDTYDADKTAPLGHSYGTTVTAPTCTEGGYTTYTCTACGHTYDADETVATGHSYGTAVTEPTCTAGGYTVYTCAACGHTYVADETEATGHSYETAVTEPTCTAGGYTTYTCAVCGHSYTADKTEMLAHSYGDWSNADEQSHVHACTLCGQQETADHTWDEGVVTVEPTEEGEGQRQHSCTLCGAVKTTAIPALSHEHRYDTVTVTAPTCIAGGYTSHTCRCGDSYQTDETAALGHSYGCSATTEGTCVAKSTATYTCAACGDSYITEGESDPANHAALVQTDSGKAPTCTQQGSKPTWACGDCQGVFADENATEPTTYAKQVLPATGHSWGQWYVAKAPACTEKGQEQRDCASCGQAETRDISAAGHRYIPQVTAPTCTEGGYTTYTCSVCSHSYQDSAVAALGHSEAVDAAVEPTCTETGLSAGKHCAVCQVILEQQKVLPALGHTDPDSNYVCDVCGSDLCVDHTEQTVPGTPATCLQPGLTDGKNCANCGEVLQAQEEIPALGHTAQVIAGKAPTCVETGLTEGSKCAVCGEILTQQSQLPLAEHSYGQWEQTKAPTTEETGLEERTCAVCGDKEQRTLEKLEPVPTEPETKPATQPATAPTTVPTQPQTHPTQSSAAGTTASDPGTPDTPQQSPVGWIVAVCVLLGAAVIAGIILKKKK